MSYTAAWVKVPKPQVKAQKPQVMKLATPILSGRFESCRGHYQKHRLTSP